MFIFQSKISVLDLDDKIYNMGYLLWHHKNNKGKLCFWQVAAKNKDKLAKILLKHQNNIFLVNVFPKEVLNNKWVQNRSLVLLQKFMYHPKTNLDKSVVFAEQTYICQNVFSSRNKALEKCWFLKDWWEVPRCWHKVICVQ